MKIPHAECRFFCGSCGVPGVKPCCRPCRHHPAVEERFHGSILDHCRVQRVAVGSAGPRAEKREGHAGVLHQRQLHAQHRIKSRCATASISTPSSIPPRTPSQKYPLLMMRTPYGIPPYEEDKYRFSLGPNRHFVREGYIFVYQDVRGCYMSEGNFDNMRPQLRQAGQGQGHRREHRHLRHHRLARQERAEQQRQGRAVTASPIPASTPRPA